jgi:hypothetical protein
MYDWSVALERKAVWLWVQLDSVEQSKGLEAVAAGAPVEEIH